MPCRQPQASRFVNRVFSAPWEAALVSLLFDVGTPRPLSGRDRSVLLVMMPYRHGCGGWTTERIFANVHRPALFIRESCHTNCENLGGFGSNISKGVSRPSYTFLHAFTFCFKLRLRQWNSVCPLEPVSYEDQVKRNTTSFNVVVCQYINHDGQNKSSFMFQILNISSSPTRQYWAMRLTRE